ncbi:hypothetical protein P8C59_000523 [Phyllachora maydis]|uniref:Uncharacterized protein n=1 Tax=Phyllachora maydis TaxID=1825666 RepID=A0AAD9M6J5_9PEZI|nr:hypothetical protein P8C59_000523 [Phyllachora maydis]
MFRSFRSRDTGGGGASHRDGRPPMATMDSQHRVDKAARLMKKGQTGLVWDAQKLSKWQRSLGGDDTARGSNKNLAPSPIVTLTVGPEGRLFAAHEERHPRVPLQG